MSIVKRFGKSTEYSIAFNRNTVFYCGCGETGDEVEKQNIITRADKILDLTKKAYEENKNLLES